MPCYLSLNRRSQIEVIIENEGVWLHGDQIEETVQEWYETNLEVDLIEEYIAAKCFDARSAFLLDANGVKPSDAAARDEDGLTLAERYSNGDMTLKQVLYAVQNKASK